MSNNVVHFLATLIQFYLYVVLARVILTWLPNVSRANPIVEFIHQLTEPVLQPIRRALPATGAIDFSPLVLLVGLHILRAMIERMAAGMWTRHQVHLAAKTGSAIDFWPETRRAHAYN